MYEYECLGCGKKYYSSVEYSRMKESWKYCDVCGDYIFYSVDELKNRPEDWLKREYGALEKILNKKR